MDLRLYSTDVTFAGDNAADGILFARWQRCASSDDTWAKRLCLADQKLPHYGEQFDLARIDPGTMAIGQGSKDHIVLRCAPSAPDCVHHVTSAKGGVNTVKADRGVIKCERVTPGACEQSFADLKALVAYYRDTPLAERKPAAQPTRSAADILGRLNARLKGQEVRTLLQSNDGSETLIRPNVDQLTLGPKTIDVQSKGSTIRIDVTFLRDHDLSVLEAKTTAGKMSGQFFTRIATNATYGQPAEKVAIPARDVAIECRDKAQCPTVADDLRTLIKLIQAPSFVPPKPTVVGPEIAGTWELYVPNPQGSFSRWTLVFNVDGSYKFTDTSSGASHQGNYKAQNGKWSLDGTWSNGTGLPPGTSIVFADQGTYQLLNADAMEFVGRFGPAVWKKIGGT
jgi:hypothetical protein